MTLSAFGISNQDIYKYINQELISQKKVIVEKTNSFEILLTHSFLPRSKCNEGFLIYISSVYKLLTNELTYELPKLNMKLFDFGYVDYQINNNVDLPPYWIGALSAAGNLFIDTPTIKIPTQNHVRTLSKYDTLFYQLNLKHREGLYTFNSNLSFNGKSELSKDIENLNLYNKSWCDMFIPSNILYSTYIDRVNYLRGVMDYKGVIENKETCIYIKSKQYFYDFVFLLLHLGAEFEVLSDNECNPCCWRICFKLKNHESPFYNVDDYFETIQTPKKGYWIINSLSLTNKLSDYVSNVFLYPGIIAQ